MASSGMDFKPSFVKIGHLIQNY